MSTQKQDHWDEGNTVGELRKLVESKISGLAEAKEMQTKMETALNKFEDQNQKVTAEQLVIKKLNEELKEKYSNLEAQFLRLGNARNDGTKQLTEYMKSFEKMIRFGLAAQHKDGVGELDVKYLRTDNDTQGGYLAPPEYVAEILKKITEMDAVRAYARVRQTTRESIIIPTRTTLFTATWNGEGGTMTPTNSTYGNTEIKVNKLTAVIPITTEQLQDAAFNMETEITQDIAESFAKAEGVAYLTGDGVNKPYGILNNADIQIVNSELAAGINTDSLIRTQGELKIGYNPIWVMNRRTLANLRLQKDAVGQYIWQIGLQAGLPNLIDGYPYASMIDMPDIGAGNKPIIFGDLMRGYNIVDNVNLSVLRDPFSLSREGKVQFIAVRRTGGQVVLPEAIKIIKCAVT